MSHHIVYSIVYTVSCENFSAFTWSNQAKRVRGESGDTNPVVV